MQITSGIYKVVNQVNNKYYIGSSGNIARRWNNHKALLRRNRHPNPHLQYAWDKYGAEAFRIELVETCQEPRLLALEQTYLDKCKLNPSDIYNTTFIAGGGNHTRGKLRIFKGNLRKIILPELFESFFANGWRRGIGPMSKDTKEKIGNANRGKKKPPFTLEHRKKLGDASRGHTHVVSDECKEKLRRAITGKRHRPESILKMGLKGEKHPLYGKHHTIDTKKKLSVALRGKFIGENNPRFDTTHYNLQNIHTEETIFTTRYDFYNKYDLNPSNVNKLIRGRIKSLGGWRLLI